ncbi:hypothetical protein EDD16DRAFT_1699255 [Pisolithus croceorrhizus]|nr:hypothetical protein EDD16DRAFT_1699255 [Pisolithus croceorrhizus]
MLPYVHQHQHLPLNYDYGYDYPYAYDIALALPQHPFTDTPQTIIPTPSDLLSSSTVEPDKPKPPRPDPLLPDSGLVNKTETQRKARQRAVAEEIGFVPTDPDTISSHEKKRHYLECLEHYVLYLHEQFRLVQTPPLALERVSTYRGLSSRSIRTLLVHMQNVNKNLHQSILAEEQVFLDLSAEVVATQDASDSFRHHPADVDPWSNYIAEPGSVVFGSEGSTYDSVSTDSPSSSRGSLDGMGFPFERRL